MRFQDRLKTQQQRSEVHISITTVLVTTDFYVAMWSIVTAKAETGENCDIRSRGKGETNSFTVERRLTPISLQRIERGEHSNDYSTLSS